MSNSKEIVNLSFFTLAIKYLLTTKNILEQIIDTGNKHVITGDTNDTWSNYEENTKWSDFNTIIPTMFLFFHGLELLCKSLLLIAKSENTSNIKLDHDLKELFNEVKKLYNDNDELVKTLEKYSNPKKRKSNIIQNFLNENPGINDVQSLYYSFRYPSTKQLKTAYNYFPMKYRGKDGLVFIKELKNDIDLLITKSKEIYNAKEYKDYTIKK